MSVYLCLDASYQEHPRKFPLLSLLLLINEFLDAEVICAQVLQAQAGFFFLRCPFSMSKPFQHLCELD